MPPDTKPQARPDRPISVTPEPEPEGPSEASLDLQRYYARVEQDLGPALEGPDQAWLKTACAPLDRPASRPTA